MDLEEVLVEKARRGDHRAFDELVAQYRERIHRLCVRILGNEEEGEQVAQEAFLLAWRNLPRFQGGSRFNTWLWVITKNQCLKLLCTRSGQDAVGGLSLDDPRSSSDSHTHVPGIEAEVISSVRAGQLLKMIPEQARAARPRWDALDLAIFELRAARGVEKARHIARLLGEKEGTVKYRIYKHIDPVLKQIYEKLKAEEDSV